MFKGVLVNIWLIVLVISISQSVIGEQANCFRIVAEDSLENALKGGKAAVVDVGEGVLFELLPGQKKYFPGPEGSLQRLFVYYKGEKVKELPESFYMGYTRIEAESMTYWMIEEYTGGLHCCTVFHFFAKENVSHPLRYIGATGGSIKLPEKASGFICQDGQVYFEDTDIRFLYFHTSFGHSQLFLPRFYHITPSSLKITNSKFERKYLEDVRILDNDIKDILVSRTAKPRALITEEKDNANFTDELGQLLVKRTILYLYARKDNKAWQSLKSDVKKYYDTTKGLEQIKKEILKILKESPY